MNQGSNNFVGRSNFNSGARPPGQFPPGNFGRGNFANRRPSFANRGGNFGNRGPNFGNQGGNFNNGSRFGTGGYGQESIDNLNNPGDNFGNKSSNFENRNSNFGNKYSNFQNRDSNFGNRNPNFENRSSNFENRGSNFGNNRSKFGNNSFDNNGPNFESSHSNFGNRSSNSNRGFDFGNNDSNFGNRNSNFRGQGFGAGPGGAGFNDYFNSSQSFDVGDVNPPPALGRASHSSGPKFYNSSRNGNSNSDFGPNSSENFSSNTRISNFQSNNPNQSGFGNQGPFIPNLFGPSHLNNPGGSNYQPPFNNFNSRPQRPFVRRNFINRNQNSFPPRQQGGENFAPRPSIDQSFKANSWNTRGEAMFRGNWNRGRGRPHREARSKVTQEQLQEKDVGITEYLSEYRGFPGILKARFSDFQVNEINLNGEIAKLTDTSIPAEFVDEKDDLDYKTATPIPEIPEEKWKEIVALVDTPVVDTIVTMDMTNSTKEERTNIHMFMKKVLMGKVTVRTISEDGKRWMEFKKFNSLEDKKDTRIQWPQNVAPYVHFILYKETMDTMEATYKISDVLKMRPNLFSYAGVKDKRAKTTQWFCVKKVNPKRLLNATRNVKKLHIGNITFKKHPLKLGQLKGNRFRIAIRNVQAPDDLIEKSIKAMEEIGFINYYGLQRFGMDKEVPTYQIGHKLMLGQWKEAIDLILKPKESDDPGSDLTNAKQIYAKTGNATAALKAAKKIRRSCIETKLIDGLAKSGANDYVNALESIPRNMRLLYIHAFQSYIWNRLVSRRIKEFGIKPIVGDLVLIDEVVPESVETPDEDDDDDEPEENPIFEEIIGSTIESKEVRRSGRPWITDDLITTVANNEQKDGEQSGSDQEKKKQNIEFVTEENLSKYTIYDVVMPLPGYDIEYPNNEVKTWYKELLEEYGLSLEMPKQKVKTYTLSGTYRKILSKVQNSSWKLIHYNEPILSLIRSDYEEMRGEEEPQTVPDGKYKGLILDFCLSSCCYATMVIREILKTDTSSQVHAQLSNLLNEEIRKSTESQEQSNAIKRKVEGENEEEEAKKSKVDES